MNRKQYLKGLKRRMVKGDRMRAARIVDCHASTVDDALDGKEGELREKALDALDQIITIREQKDEERKRKYSQS